MSKIAQLIARYQWEGLLREEHPFLAVAALFGPLIYLTMMRDVMPREMFPQVNLAAHIDYFLEGRLTYVE